VHDLRERAGPREVHVRRRLPADRGAMLLRHRHVQRARAVCPALHEGAEPTEAEQYAMAPSWERQPLLPAARGGGPLHRSRRPEAVPRLPDRRLSTPTGERLYQVALSTGTDNGNGHGNGRTYERAAWSRRRAVKAASRSDNSKSSSRLWRTSSLRGGPLVLVIGQGHSKKMAGAVPPGHAGRAALTGNCTQ